jgi:N-methylhydantoinase A
VSFHCGVDIGGTFTDCVIVDSDGNITLAKTSSTPPDFTRGFIDALELGAGKIGLSLPDFLAQTDLLLHGTTVGTNVLVQLNGARTGLITTRGHRDALIMMRSSGRSAGLPIEQLLHLSRHRKPEPIVPPARIKEVSERVDWAGDVVLGLNEAEARAAIEELVEQRVEAIAIAFLWGFVNPAHELAVKALVHEIAPEMFVSCAHELIAKPGEYERTAAAAINAFIGPATSRYIRAVDAYTADGGYKSPLLIMQASGGVVPAEEAAAKPLFTIGSGPVGGVTGAAYLASRLGHPNVIACDMGGTSFDVGIIANGRPLTASETIINQYTFYMPRLDIESIGAGGGSVLWVNPLSGTPRVGPQSAGALPGPACYGRGGELPTITDCDLVLGRYNADAFLGGDLHLDADAALRAVKAVADELEMDPVDAAAGALRIVESQMADLMRQMTVERGLDPRQFLIYAFGGACAAHAVAFARELGAPSVVIPLGDLASTWSALGVATSDAMHVYEHAELLQEPYSGEHLTEVFERLEEQAREQLLAEGFAESAIQIDREAEMRFSIQIHQLEVPVPDGKLSDAHCEALIEDFVDRYEQTFGKGTAFRGAGTQTGLLRVVGRGLVRRPQLPELEPGTVGAPGSRDVWWPEYGRFHATPAYGPSALSPGTEITGPAMIDLTVTTIAIPAGATAVVDPLGSIVIDVGRAPADPADVLQTTFAS